LLESEPFSSPRTFTIYINNPRSSLPVIMTTEALGDALKTRFESFKEFKVNVTWKSKPGPNGVPKSLPTGWIQFKVCHTTRAWFDTSGKRHHLTIFFRLCLRLRMHWMSPRNRVSPSENVQ
jgi:hypothetical protein